MGLCLFLALRVNTTLTTLDIGLNNIGKAGVQHIAEALRVNTTLTSLNLNNTNIGDAGAQHVATALQANTTLITLYLCNNGISEAGAQHIAAALRVNTRLTALYLSGNNIEKAGARCKVEAQIKANQSLDTVRPQIEEVQALIASNWMGGKQCGLPAELVWGELAWQIEASYKRES